MALSTAQLTTFYTVANQGAAPTAAKTAQIAAISASTATDAAKQAQIGMLLQDTVGVATLTYAFFGNTTPSAAGLAYLVASKANTSDLNDAYYAQFNQENRYFNFALNLAASPASAYASAFATSFAAPTIEQTISTAYDQIIGSANATAAGVDPVAGKAYFLGSLDFYKAVVTGRGGIAATDPRFDLAVKAVIIGSILNEAVKAGLGAYADAYERMVTQLETGVVTGLGGPLLTNYAEFQTTFTAAAAGFNTATSTSSVEHTVASDTTSDLINTTIARLAGAVVNGKGAPGYDRLFITDVIATPVTLGDGGSGGTISGVEQLELKGSTALVTGPSLAGSGIATITFDQATMFQTAATGGQTINGSSGNDAVTIKTGGDTINLGAGSDTVHLTIIAPDLILDGGGTGTDVLDIASGSGLTGLSTIAGFETIAFAAGGASFTLSPTVNSYLQALPAGVTITGLSGSADSFFLTGAGTTRGLTSVENYNLLTALSFSLGSASQNVGAAAGAQIITDESFNTLTGRYTTSDNLDLFVLDRGGSSVSLAGASLNGTFAALNLANGTDVSLNINQAANFLSIAGLAVNGANVVNAVQLLAGTGGNASFPSLVSIESLDASVMGAGTTLTVASANDMSVNLGSANMIGNAGTGGTPGYTVTAAGDAQTITLNGGGADKLTIAAGGSGAMNISTGPGDDVITFANRAQLTSADIIDTGLGTDRIEILAGTGAANDFDNVKNVEAIVDRAGLITSKDALIAAGIALDYSVGTSTVVAAVDFGAELNGKVNVTLGSGGGVVQGTNNILTDTFTLPTVHAAARIDFDLAGVYAAGNLITQIANVDKITGFNAATDSLDLAMAVGHVYNNGLVGLNSSSSTTTVASLITLTSGLTLALGDVVLMPVGAGHYFLFQHITGSAWNVGDFVVELIGESGALTTANFV